jgi:uncharacterized protein YjbI with pentapeptide repeats
MMIKEHMKQPRHLCDKQSMPTERMKRSAMTIPVQQQANHADTARTRTDVVRLLQDVGRPEQLDISGQNVREINLMNCDLRGANLSQVSACAANLCGTNLSKANLHGADLRGTYLCWADLRGANLCEADLCEADLSWANLCEADLRGANLDRAILYGTILGRADLRGVSWDTTDVRGADLSWSCLGEASAYELKYHLRRRGAIFRETTNVKVVERFSDKASTFALGFSLGFLLMSVVGFLGMVGMREIRHFLGLKRFFVH